MLTLSEFLEEKIPENQKDLLKIVETLTDSCIIISRKISFDYKKEPLFLKNESGDFQNNIDIMCNDILVNQMRLLDSVSSIISEEQDSIIRTRKLKRKYSVAFDPLDGSSNIECEGDVGTIFSIYNDTGGFPSGREILFAGYVLYGYRVTLVFTFGDNTYKFVLNKDEGYFYKSSVDVTIPENPKKTVSTNMGNYKVLFQNDKNICDFFIENRYKTRYSACMVMDVHRILMDGGVFFYPNDTKNKNGKLRLIYECYPMSFLIESCGGIATDGNTRILNLDPNILHQKCPIYLGCKRDMFLIKKLKNNFIPVGNVSIIENYDGSGEDELTVRTGDVVKDFTVLDDSRWSKVTLDTGEKGIIPTKSFLNKI